MTQLARAGEAGAAGCSDWVSVGRCAGDCVRACVRDRTACRGVSSVGDWGGGLVRRLCEMTARKGKV